MSNYLSEAFKKLDILDEDVFEVDKDGLTALKDFEDSDDEEDTITVVDPDAEDEEELEDSYIGKVILDCAVCHTDIYKDKEEVTIDEESGLANIGEECPYCYSSEGFKVIGEVKPFVEVEVDTDDDVDVEVDGEEVEKNESLRRNRRLRESIKDWEFIKYDGVGPVESDAYYKYIGNDIQLVIYPPQTVAGDTYDTWEAEIYTDNGSSYQSVDDTRDGFDSFEEAEAWINNKLKNLGESLRRKPRKMKESILSEARIKKSWKKIDTVDAEVLDRTRVVAPNSKKYGFYNGEIDFEGTRLPKRGTKLKVDIYDISDDQEWRQYGDEPYYAVINKTKPVKESIEDITIDTGEQEITVSAKDKEEAEPDGEMIAPLSDEAKSDIETGSDDTVDVDVDEFSEEDFDELGESYLKKVYENVDSYRTVSAKTKGNKLYLEGLIKFNSGKQKKTSFVFESKTITKTGKAKLIGENLQISRGHKSFKLTGTINNGKFISESLNYNYRVKNGNESQRVYGTAKKSK